MHAAESLALAALGLLVHVDRDTVPSDLVQLEIDVPDKLKVTRVDASKVRVASTRNFAYDPRLSK